MTDDATTPRSGDEAAAPQAAATPIESRSMVWLLLASLVLIQFSHPITERGGAWMAAYLLVYGGVITFAVRSVQVEPRRHWVLAVCSVLLVAGGTWFLFDQTSEAALQAMLVGMGLLQLALLVLLLRVLVDPPRGINGIDLLMLAVCAFLLIGGVFGVAAALLELSAPGSFSDPETTIVPLPWQSLLYGSFVTLSALGFGDVTPVSAWARSLFSFEGVFGVLFVAVVVSRLVSVAGQAVDEKS